MSHKEVKGKYTYDDDEDYVPMKKVKYSFKDDNPMPQKKHTLDSDEEEEDDDEKAARKKREELKDEEIDGQEDATIDYEGETKITPFNIKEEMEEGHFDRDGFYHFKKDSELIQDAWLEDIDWVKVKHRKQDIAKYGSDIESDPEEDSALTIPDPKKEKNDAIEIYRNIRSILQPGETVAKALKRLGGSKTKRLTSAERWKLKKQGKSVADDSCDMANFNELTGFANQIIESGNMDVYQETYEMINLKIERHDAAEKAAASGPSLDMFSDDAPNQKENPALNSNEKDTFDEVQWQYRWKNNEDSKIFGPFSTEKMIQWKEADFFKDGAFVRKTTDQDVRWYPTARVDFDLYV